MSEKKKDLKAFLAKQTKKVKKTTTADPEKPAEEEEKIQTAEVIKKETKKTKDTKQESSDEEVDDEQELEKGMDLGFAKIKEQKEVKGDKEQLESEKRGFGFDDTDKPFARGTAIAAAKKEASGDIVFSGARPMKFGRKKGAGGAFAAEFSEGLGDIDDDGKIKKNKNKTTVQQETNNTPAIVGGREWVNLGAGARERRDDEEVRADRPAAVKPTFKGRMNLTKTGAAADDDKDYGVKTNYGFAVSYKTEYDGEKGEGGEKRERKPRDRGVPFGQHEKDANNDSEDEGFMVIKGRERKAKVAKDGSSSEEEGGFEVKRGGDRGRGGGGRGGGFFKNSSKRTVD